MKILVILFFMLIPIQLCAQDQYSKDKAEVKKTGQTWVILVGENW